MEILRNLNVYIEINIIIISITVNVCILGNNTECTPIIVVL